MLKECAKSAETPSPQTNTKTEGIAAAPVPVVSAVKIKRITKQPRETVYNMEVDRYHNFAVNGGLIVHNSIDAVRYALNPVWRRKGQ